MELNLCEKEQRLMSFIKKGEDDIKTMTYRQDILLTKNLIDFYKLIIKYNNLKDIPKEGIYQRESLIKFNKLISVKEMQKLGIDFVEMSGVYVPLNVYFIDQALLDEFYLYATEDNRKKLGIPDNLILSASVPVDFGYCRKVYAVIERSSFADRYVLKRTDWSYPLW